MDTVFSGRPKCSMDSDAIGVATGKQACSGSRANGLRGVKIGKSHSVGCDRIDIRCAVTLLSITTQIAVSEIVCEDDDDVGPIVEGPGSIPSKRDSKNPKRDQRAAID